MSSKGKPFILTIDDDEDFNRLVKMVLSKLEVDVECYSDPEKFLKRLNTSNPSLCVIDLNLDRNFGAGFKIIQAIRNKKGENLPLIVMSKRSSNNDIAYAFEMGASDYISKPLDDIVFLSKVKQFITIQDGTHVKDTDHSKTTLPHNKVAAMQTPCKVELAIKIKEISEFGITIVGEHFFAKGTSFSLSSELINQILATEHIFLTVHNNWYDSEKGNFGAYLEFDGHNDQLLTSVRNWLMAESADT